MAVPAGTDEALDVGLFGPDSVTWRVHDDPSGLVGGVRALMLETLHPLAMAGVDQHSTFREDPMGRLERTGSYLDTVVFGTTSAARRASARVRGVHARLSGVEPESGQAYRVSDPHLLTWVHNTSVDSFLTAYRRVGPGLSDADADRYVDEQRRAAALLGVDPDTLPRTVGGLEAYLHGIRGELRPTRAAQETLRFLFVPPLPGALAALLPLYQVVANAAFGSLPRWARAAWGPRAWLSLHPLYPLGSRVGGLALTAALRELHLERRRPAEAWSSRRRQAGQLGAG